MKTYALSPRRLIFWMLLPLLMGGCVPRFDLDAMQPRADVEAPPVYGEHTAGQTFVATRPNLCAIEVAWKSTPPTGPLVLYLRTAPDAATYLARAVRFADEVGAKAMVRWTFPPDAGSRGRRYYFEVQAPQATADRPLRLDAMGHDVYGTGEAYADGLPRPGDLTFRALYCYDLAMAWGDMVSGARRAWLLLPVALILLAPGWGLLTLWRDARHHFDVWERGAMAVGLSLAVWPLLLLWTTEAGGRFPPYAAWIVGGVGATVAITAAAVRHTLPSRRALRPHHALMALTLTAGLLLRLLAVRDLALPPWVDSVHHAVIARLIADGGRVPETYMPYVAVDRATYHYGFHAVTAALVWLSGLAVPQAMLLMGQLLNAAAALSLYLLARWLTRQRGAAFLTAFIVALIATMPAYYVSWGRYTHLAGVLLLPVATILTVEAARRRRLSLAFLATVASAGLIVVHYRLFAFHLLLVGAWWLVALLADLRAWRARGWEELICAAVTLAAVVALMPWFGGVVQHLWLRALREWGGGGATVHWDFSWRYVTAHLDRYVLTLGTAGLMAALVQRRRFAALLLLWMAALFVLTNPSKFGLPGEGLTNNVAMLITWFIPLSVGAGYLIAETAQRWLSLLPQRWHRGGRLLAVVGMAAVGVAGARVQLTILNPNNVLALKADRAAMAWIDRETPPDSSFLINPMSWQAGVYIGSDGGYWITPLTGRRTTTPPALYPLGSLKTTVYVQTLAQAVERAAADPSRLHDLLRKEGIDYVYIGALGGVLDPAQLKASPHFRLAYDGGRVRIFAVEP